MRKPSAHPALGASYDTNETWVNEYLGKFQEDPEYTRYLEAWTAYYEASRQAEFFGANLVGQMDAGSRAMYKVISKEERHYLMYQNDAVKYAKYKHAQQVAARKFGL